MEEEPVPKQIALPKYVDEIDPRELYAITELCYCSGLTYGMIFYHVKKGHLRYSKPVGSRQIRVQGQDFLKWLNVSKI